MAVMTDLKVSDTQKKALVIATILAVILGIFFLRHYLLLIISAIVAAVVFNPIYLKLKSKKFKPHSAATLTLLVTIIAIIIPVAIIVVLASYQIANIVDGLNLTSQNTDLNQLLESAIKTINSTLSDIGIPFQLTESGVRDHIINFLQTAGQTVFSLITSWVSGIGSFITTLIIYIYVFLAILINQEKLIEFFKRMNPLGRQISDLYIKRAHTMTKAMVKGQFVIAFCQGLTGAIFLYLAGFHSTFFFFLIILTLLSIVPLGGGILSIPIGIVMLLLGDYWQGILILAGHLLIVTNIDNVLRPKLVPSEARLDPALTLLSVFSGLALFGFLGIVLGPVIMILIVTTVNTFLKVFKNA